MPVLSFRIKLLLAMMLVVAGVTVTTLFTTTRAVERTYQDLFEGQFESQIEAFAEAQDIRLEPVRNVCRLITQSPRIIAALQSNSVNAVMLYSSAAGDVRTVVGEGYRGPRQPRANYWGFLDARGRVIEPPSMEASGMDFGENKKRFQEQMAFARLAMSSKDKQEIGYTPPPGKQHRGQPHEVILTKIIDPQSHKVLGAFVVGFPLPDLEQRALNKVSQIMTGMLLGTNLFSQTIPSNLVNSVARMVAAEVKQTGQHAHRDLAIQVAGVPHRIFYTPMNEESEFPVAYQVGLFPLQHMLEQERNLRLRVLAFGAAMMLGALLLSLFLSHGLAVPLKSLVRATEEIQRENYSHKVVVNSRDELGVLAESFNRMADGLALKDRYFNVLNMVADRAVADELIHGRVALGGETREVTVLFCDIRGFTGLTQNMPPQEVIALLNEHMQALTDAVHRHHGVVDKYMGDMIMALFGAPKSYGDDALNAARCALEMIRIRENLNQTSKHRLNVGIGIATGAMVAGCMGSADRANYTVLGDRVNLASRLSAQTSAMQVLMDDATRDRLGNRAQVQTVSGLRLKGFDEPVQAFQLISLGHTRALTPVAG